LKPYKYLLKNQSKWEGKKEKEEERGEENLDEKTKCEGSRA
jgi:hypothetical protein